MSILRSAKMKKSMITMIVLWFIVGICGCQPITKPTGPYTAYLPNEAKSELLGVDVKLTGKNLEEKIENLMIILKNGAEDKIPAIPNGIEILNIKIEKKQVILSFNELYNQLPAIDEIICRSAIVKSLTQMDGIDSVEFYIGSIPYKTADGVIIGAMKKEDIVLDFNEEDQDENLKTVTLYFSDKNAANLIPVEVEVSVNSNEQIEATVLKMLIEGPKDEDLYATVPIETKIKNVSVKEGVCYVDFNEAFVTKHMGGSAGEMMTIYSIVNTLTDLPNINKVQFLIEGTVREEYKGHYQFNILFQKNLDLVKK